MAEQERPTIIRALGWVLMARAISSGLRIMEKAASVIPIKLTLNLRGGRPHVCVINSPADLNDLRKLCGLSTNKGMVIKCSRFNELPPNIFLGWVLLINAL